MRQDIVQQLADYRGVLHWDSFSAYDNGGVVTRPAVDIPLYIKEHPLPFRKPKPTEIATVPTIDPMSGFDNSWQAVFWGAPDLLQITVSGWIITPIASGAFTPVDAAGSLLNLGNISYAELISAYIEGRMNQTIKGASQRKDPTYYISPQGHKYNNPIIAVWDPQYSPTMRKQPFSMTLYLEK